MQAIKGALEEEPTNKGLDRYKREKIDLYVGLSTEEAQLLANLHNKRTNSKKMFFQVNYWLRYGEDENQAIQASLAGQREQALVIGLLPDTWYYISVQVYNDAGNGQKSEKYPQKTFRRAPHMYPTEVRVHSYSSDSVKVTFRGVPTSAEEETLQGYKIRVWETSDNLRQAYDIDVGRAVSGIVSGIKRHSFYKMRVLGYSRGGDGTMSSPPTMFTLDKCCIEFFYQCRKTDF